MYRIPLAPPPNTDTHQTADFMEWTAWRDGFASLRSTHAAIDRLDDNLCNDGCDDDSDRVAIELDDVYLELERRSDACNGGYPFALKSGSILVHTSENHAANCDTYRFLLLATRLNMQTQSIHANLNATNIMEELGSAVIRNYLGGNRSRAIVFGTSAGGSFRENVDALCKELGEGGGFKQTDTGRVYARDAKLDCVSWIPFSDRNPGKLVVFTQCKTGTSWRSTLSQLQPDAFLKTWTVDRAFCFDPIRAFCIAEAIGQSRWTETATQAGLFFDRCRLVDFATELTKGLHDEMYTWTATAFEFAQTL